MNVFSRGRMNLWIIVVLVILNLVSLGVIYHEKAEDSIFQDGGRKRHGPPEHEKWFRQELGLNQEQYAFFKAEREKLFSRLHPEKGKIRSLNIAIVDEAFSDNPDPLKISKWSAEIGDTEKNLSMMLFDHLLVLKSKINSAQQEKLHRFFVDLMRHAGPPPRPPDRKK